MSGLIPSGIGQFRRVELRGPRDITVYAACFMVLRAAYIMPRMAGMNALDRHMRKIWQLYRDYGSAVWHLLYQAEARLRSEEMPHIQRTLARESQAVTKAGGAHPYGAKRPWAQVWVYATSDTAD